MGKDVEQVRKRLIAPYPNSAFMLLPLYDLLACCDTDKDKKQFMDNFHKHFEKYCPSILKMFPEYRPEDLLGAVQIVSDTEYEHRLIHLRNAVVLVLSMAEELKFDTNLAMDLSNEELEAMLVSKMKEKRNNLHEYIESNGMINKRLTFSAAFGDYWCKKLKMKRNDPGFFSAIVTKKIEQYDAILNSSDDDKDNNSSSIGDMLDELSVVVDWSLFEPINPDKLELAMAHRFIIDLTDYEKTLEKELGNSSDVHATVSERGPEYIDFLCKFVNDYEKKMKANPKYGLAIKTKDAQTRADIRLTHELLYKRASRILAGYPDALDMGGPDQYDGKSYGDVKKVREEIREAQEQRRQEEEKRCLEAQAARERQEVMEKALSEQEELISMEIAEQAAARNEKIEELLSKINGLSETAEVYSKELKIWEQLLIEEKRERDKKTAIRIVTIGGKLFTPGEAGVIQEDSRQKEKEEAEKLDDHDALARINELARRQKFYYDNLDIIAVIKFDDMDIYVSSSGCLYTEPATQSGVGHNAVYVLHYSNARQLFERKIVKQEVRSEKVCNESRAIKYFPHIDGWEERLTQYNKEASQRNDDKEGVVQFVHDMSEELTCKNQKRMVFSSKGSSNKRAAS